jgi:protein SCO1/2
MSLPRLGICLIAFQMTGALLAVGRAAADQAPSADQAPAADHCAAAAKPSPFVRSQHEYSLPEVTLRDQAGRPVAVSELQGASGPLAVNFIFTTCTTICPVMTATFAQMRRDLGPEADRIRLVSITIDPEHDTPAVLAEYAERFGALPGWSFLTGSPEDVERVLRAFDVWSGSRTSHRPVTLLRRRGEREWVRLDGLGSGAALADQARTVLD